MVNVQEQLRDLVKRELSGAWNEMDVREELLAPLLRLLGYGKGTDYDINREQHLLKHPFLMVGSEKVKLDYAVLARRRHVWVLEAKRPTIPLDEKVIHQAYFYAIHPEVQARYFAICNGREFALYDVRALDERYEPALRFPLRDLESRFAELRAILGIDRVRDELARRALLDLEKVLLTELRKERVDEIDRSIRSLLTQARQAADENARALWKRRSEEEDEDLREMFANDTPTQMARTAFEYFDTPHHFGVVYGVFREKLLALDDVARRQAIVETLGVFERDITSTHRVHLIQAVLRSLPDVPVVLAGQIRTVAQAEVAGILSGFPDDDRKRLLWKLEGLVNRVPYKVSMVKHGFTDDLALIVRRKRTTLPEEDLVHRGPSVWGERGAWSQRRASELFHQFVALPSAQLEATTLELERLERACQSGYSEATRQGFDGEATPPHFVNFDDPLDSYRSSLCSMLLAEFGAVLPWFDDAMLTSLEALLLRVREPEYAINHADVLWVRVIHARGGMDTPLDPESGAPLAAEAIDLLMRRPMINRTGWSAVDSGILIRGEIASGRWAQYPARLDIPQRRLRVEKGTSLA